MKPLSSALLLGVFAALTAYPCLNAQVPTARSWTNQQGKTLTATFQRLDGNSVILKLQDGTLSAVPLVRLSVADQEYVKKAGSVAVPTAVSGPLTWPTAISVSPTAMTVTEGVQDAAAREYHYETGNFHFVSNAPLSKAIVRDVAADFELVRSFIGQMPWGWEPRPQDGKFFKVKFTETNAEFYAAGGSENSSAGMKDDYIFFKLSSMGIEKVGGRYTLDPKRRTEGEVVGMTLRLLFGEMRYYTPPWAMMGLERVLRKVAYREDTLKFTDLTSALKDEVKTNADMGVILDSERMLKCLRTVQTERGPDVLLYRRQNYFDAMLLCYFFGFLDGDGKGGALHEYYQGMAEEAMAYRRARLEGARPPRTTGTWVNWAQDHLDRFLAGRDDTQLKAEILAAYAAIGIKLSK